MHLTDDMEQFKQLRFKNDAGYEKIDRHCNSYWNDDTEEMIWEYGFNQPVDLIRLFSEYIDAGRARLLTKSVFVNKANKVSKDIDDADTTLPEFVYNF